MKRALSAGLLAVTVLSLASCDYQKYNTVRQADYRANDQSTTFRAGDEEVYGLGKDSAAVQTRYKYTANPNLDAKADKIRAKLYGKGNTTQSL
jgi:predicted small lipoprotein YifL